MYKTGTYFWSRIYYIQTANLHTETFKKEQLRWRDVVKATNNGIYWPALSGELLIQHGLDPNCSSEILLTRPRFVLTLCASDRIYLQSAAFNMNL